MLVNDAHIARRRQQALDQALLQQMQDISSTYYTSHQESVKRNSRPVSWHPSCHLPEPQSMPIQVPQPDFSQFNMAMPTPYQPQNLPPTPAAYSGHTSPVASYSPLILPCAAIAQPTAIPNYASPEPWIPTSQIASNYINPRDSPEPVGPFSVYSDQVSFNNWDAYAPHGLQSCTAPPTPDEFQGIQQPQSVPSEESIPYEPLETPEEEEEEGEILVGMGLYDLPSKADTDPGLVHYRTTTSQLLDTTYRSGKGWKLEEAWEPPATDDEDSEEDADADEQGEEDKTTESTPA